MSKIPLENDIFCSKDDAFHCTLMSYLYMKVTHFYCLSRIFFEFYDDEYFLRFYWRNFYSDHFFVAKYYDITIVMEKNMMKINTKSDFFFISRENNL